ncbi:MAG: hypothetical protein K2P98_06110, partial [Neisseriaceae bacterium]|nr:hypothetical protein [Neisseriaceae bacterium]
MLCKNCDLAVCPLCLLMGEHKGHNYVAIEERAKRTKIELQSAKI